MCRLGSAFRFFGLLIFVLVCARPDLAAAQTTAEPVRTVGGVIDYAGLFQPQEKRSLEMAAGQMARKTGTDFFVVTVDDRAGQWAERASHFAMVDSVFKDTEKAVLKHFGRAAPLTVLLTFKSSVVLHWRTSREDLQEVLLYKNFYGGAADALRRIRQKNEPYAAAAFRYLTALEQTIDAFEATPDRAAVSPVAQAERAQFWLFQRFALLSTRNLLQNEWIDPFFKVFCTALSFLATHLLLPGWIGFLLIMAGLYLALLVPGYLLEQRFGVLGDLAGDGILAAAFALPLILLFAVSQADLETLLFVSQRFGGELLTYLDWANEIATHSFPVSGTLIVLAAAAVGIMEFTKRLRALLAAFDTPAKFRAQHSGSEPVGIVERSPRPIRIPILFVLMVFLTLSSVGWVVSLVIWPGLVATFFASVSILRRVLDFAMLRWSGAPRSDARNIGSRGPSIVARGGAL